MRRAISLIVVIGSLIGSLTACSGSSAAGSSPSATEQLATAKSLFDAAAAVTLNLSGADVPKDANGVRTAQGTGVRGTDGVARFKGTIGATVKGISGTVDLICIGEDTYMKFFTPGYVKTDLADLGAPNPVTFFDTAQGLSSLLAKTANPAVGGTVRERAEVLTEITGTLPGDPIVKLLHLGAAGSSFDVTYGLAANGELRTAKLSGPFYAGTTSTYTIRLTDYGQTIPIDAP